MWYHVRMKYLVSWLILLSVLTPTPAGAIDRQQCKFQSYQRGEWTLTEMHMTARCVANRWTPPGGLRELVKVISCESGWFRHAVNGRYVGLAQHDRYAWPARVRAYEPPHWDLRPAWGNPRSQLTVTTRMADQGGWSPWAGCA